MLLCAITTTEYQHCAVNHIHRKALLSTRAGLSPAFSLFLLPTPRPFLRFVIRLRVDPRIAITPQPFALRY